jgi:hypothetical protein
MRIASEDDLLDAELADFPGLMAVSQFARMLDKVPWFSVIGEPLDERELILAEDYLLNLGFPEAVVAAVEDFETAEEAIRNHDLNTAFWETEEQTRMSLYAEAVEKADEETLSMALTFVGHAAAEPIQFAAEAAFDAFGIRDDELVRAAAGSAQQACHQVALVLAAELEEEEEQARHPFALKYRLFEMGRWPLGLVGASYYLF